MAGPTETNNLVKVRDRIYVPQAARGQASNRANSSAPPYLRIVGKTDESTSSLWGDAFDEKYAAVCRALPDRFDRLVGR